MEILILGGTDFIGRHITGNLFAKGHAVTLFNRGRTNPGLFPETKKLVGDRDGNLRALEGLHWDAVIDLSGYVPRHVRNSSRLLKNVVNRYIFFSTIYVYSKSISWQSEDDPVLTIHNLETEDVNAKTYGPLKVLCEKEAQANVPNGVLVLRPGYCVGPYDYTDRFTYWVRRVCSGGEMLAPGEPACPFQYKESCKSAVTRLLFLA